MVRKKKSNVRTVSVQASGGVPRFNGKCFTTEVPVDIIMDNDYDGLVEYLKRAFTEHFLFRFVVVNNVHYSLLDLEPEEDNTDEPV